MRKCKSELFFAFCSVSNFIDLIVVLLEWICLFLNQKVTFSSLLFLENRWSSPGHISLSDIKALLGEFCVFLCNHFAHVFV